MSWLTSTMGGLLQTCRRRGPGLSLQQETDRAKARSSQEGKTIEERREKNEVGEATEATKAIAAQEEPHVLLNSRQHGSSTEGKGVMKKGVGSRGDSEEGGERLPPCCHQKEEQMSQQHPSPEPSNEKEMTTSAPDPSRRGEGPGEKDEEQSMSMSKSRKHSNSKKEDPTSPERQNSPTNSKLEGPSALDRDHLQTPTQSPGDSLQDQEADGEDDEGLPNGTPRNRQPQTRALEGTPVQARRRPRCSVADRKFWERCLGKRYRFRESYMSDDHSDRSFPFESDDEEVPTARRVQKFVLHSDDSEEDDGTAGSFSWEDWLRVNIFDSDDEDEKFGEDSMDDDDLEQLYSFDLEKVAEALRSGADKEQLTSIVESLLGDEFEQRLERGEGLCFTSDSACSESGSNSSASRSISPRARREQSNDNNDNDNNANDSNNDNSSSSSKRKRKRRSDSSRRRRRPADTARSHIQTAPPLSTSSASDGPMATLIEQPDEKQADSPAHGSRTPSMTSNVSGLMTPEKDGDGEDLGQASTGRGNVSPEHLRRSLLQAAASRRRSSLRRHSRLSAAVEQLAQKRRRSLLADAVERHRQISIDRVRRDARKQRVTLLRAAEVLEAAGIGTDDFDDSAKDDESTGSCAQGPRQRQHQQQQQQQQQQSQQQEEQQERKQQQKEETNQKEAERRKSVVLESLELMDEVMQVAKRRHRQSILRAYQEVTEHHQRSAEDEEGTGAKASQANGCDSHKEMRPGIPMPCESLPSERIHWIIQRHYEKYRASQSAKPSGSTRGPARKKKDRREDVIRSGSLLALMNARRGEGGPFNVHVGPAGPSNHPARKVTGGLAPAPTAA